MEEKVRKQYNSFDSQRKQANAQEADRKDMEELKALEQLLKKKK